MERAVFQFVPIASLILSLGSTEKYLAVSSLFYEILLSLFFSWLCNHSSITLSSCQLPQSFNDLHGLSVDLLECAHVLRSPGQDSTAGVSLLCWDEGNHHLPGPAGTALPDAAQGAVGFLCHKNALQALIQPVARQDLVLIMFGNSFQGFLVYLQNEGKGLK